MKYFWQPDIDNWVIKESDSSAYGSSNTNNTYAGDKMAGGSNASFTGGIPIKSEEEEEHDKLDQPYKGLTTLSRLKEQINQILEDAYNFSKTDKEDRASNPYEKIINILDNPDLKTMLGIASDEIKKKSLSSF